MDGRSEVVSLEASRPLSDRPFRQPAVAERFEEYEHVCWWEDEGWYHQAVRYRAVRIELVPFGELEGGQRRRVEGPWQYWEPRARTIEQLRERVEAWVQFQQQQGRRFRDAAGSENDA